MSTMTSHPRSPISPTRAQSLSDSDHCTIIPPPPSSTSSEAASLGVSQHNQSQIQRARSGSRTYSEVQAEERELARRRTRSRERGEKSDEGTLQEGDASEGSLSYGELKAEMETLLSLRRRSMSQPLTVDPDLPPSAPASSSPNPSSSSRPKLSLTINTAHLSHPSGGPVSPTAPSPAETGTLIRRKSSVGGRLPSEFEHPLPPLPPISTTLSPTLSTFPPQSAFSPTSSSDSSHSSPSTAPTENQLPQQQQVQSESPEPQTQTQTQTQDLFWLPASLHPELAPREFKAFLRDATRPEALARRTSLNRASSLGPNGGSTSRIGRRASMLRGEYKPRVNDGVESEGVGSGMGGLKRTGSRRDQVTGGLAFEELTILDLQRLEELAKKAEREGGEGEEEGERLGRVLRRSLSLNPHRMAEAAARGGAKIETGSSELSSSLPASHGSPLYPFESSPHQTIYSDPSSITNSSSNSSPSPATALDTIEDFDSPLIVPPPGQILRRNARTKIRKTGPGGEVSFGHRTGGGGGSRLGLRSRNSTDGSGLSLGGGGGEESSTDSHETEDLRASTSSLNSLGGGGSQRPVSAPQIESPPLDGGAQYLEIAPSIPHVEQSPNRRTSASSTEVSINQALPPVAKPISPPPQLESVVSPASADYDWASQHLPQPPPTPSPAPAPRTQSERQYAVHPSHGHSPSPTPQAVPIPVPQPERERERERSNSVSSIGSSKSSIVSQKDEKKDGTFHGVKEKKSGWAAKLGLGGGGDDKKKKGKSKETANHHHQSNEKVEQILHVEDHKPSSTSSKAKDTSGTSNSLFGGLFGRRRTEYDSPPTPSSSSSTTPAVNPLSNALAPPPPPTASGALLPNGRYANFYRLPIHVERAIYRLSHIKLANPRRPLYEQVLISNLMFWYLGLIQKPQPPPPAAPPVPIPGKRSSNPSSTSSSPSSQSSPNSPSNSDESPPPSSSKRGGLSKQSRQPSPNNPQTGGNGGGGSRVNAEMPIKPASYEHQGRELNQEQQQQQQRYHQHRSQPQAQPSSSPQPGELFTPQPQYEPLPISSSPPQLSPTRDASSPSPSSDDDDDDDRPLAESLPLSRSRQSSTSPSRLHPTPITNPPKRPQDFEVTSRRNSPPLVSKTLETGDGGEERDRRVSVMSNKSLSEIYEAYGAGASPPLKDSLGLLPERGSSLHALGTEGGEGRE
ncbi:hypothetical protein JCM5353_002443 [Sporobolomyces roseus]